MRRFFITGTDTDCGKTYITQQLPAIFRKMGRRSIAIKPLATGVLPQHTLPMSDVQCLQLANAPDKRSINLHSWPEPIAPHLAAAKRNIIIRASDIAQYCQSKSFDNIDILCIEGAGGLMMPLNFDETWVDVITLLNAEVIFVVGIKLGCLNHALLSFLSLKHHGIRCAGWIANCLQPDMLSLEENIHTLERMISSPCLAINRWNGQLDESFLNMGYNQLFTPPTVT